MPHIIKNDTDSYIMKNGVAYGDGLTGYVIKNGVYYDYVSNPAGSSSNGISSQNSNNLPDDDYV